MAISPDGKILASAGKFPHSHCSSSAASGLKLIYKVSIEVFGYGI